MISSAVSPAVSPCQHSFTVTGVQQQHRYLHQPRCRSIGRASIPTDIVIRVPFTATTCLHIISRLLHIWWLATLLRVAKHGKNAPAMRTCLGVLLLNARATSVGTKEPPMSVFNYNFSCVSIHLLLTVLSQFCFFAFEIHSPSRCPSHSSWTPAKSAVSLIHSLWFRSHGAGLR